MKRKSKHYIVSTIQTTDGQLHPYNYELTIRKNKNLNMQNIIEFTKAEFQNDFKQSAELVFINNIIKDIK